MQIDLFKHPELVHGAARMEPTEAGIRFCRMNFELEKIYSECEAREIRANCTSGVRIAFRTDSGFVALALRYGRESRHVYAVDVIVDGLKRLTFAPSAREDEFAFDAELPPGEHEVEIYLPHLVECTLTALEVEEGAALSPLPARQRSLLFLGDSITQGMTVSSPARTWPALFSAVRNADFVNLAVGGARMNDAIGSPALDYEWDTVFIAFGINDFNGNTPMALLKERTRRLLSTLSARADARICLITPLVHVGNTATNAEGFTLGTFRAELARTAAEFPAVMQLDGTNLLPDDAGMFVDNLHPNDTGMALLARNIAALVQS